MPDLAYETVALEQTRASVDTGRRCNYNKMPMNRVIETVAGVHAGADIPTCVYGTAGK